MSCARQRTRPHHEQNDHALRTLRHGAERDGWLNAGVPETKVARRAGHGVVVLLKVYAHCIDGQAEAVNRRIGDALIDTGPLPANGSQWRDGCFILPVGQSYPDLLSCLACSRSGPGPCLPPPSPAVAAVSDLRFARLASLQLIEPQDSKSWDVSSLDS
jgi:hypothetical protein